jgi:transcriptional regulator with XRE-family HTH domain
MTTPLARQIITRAKAKNISMSTLGKESGIKDQTIRNILAGRSRKPNAEVLYAIASILNCTVEELLMDQELFQESDPSQSKEEIRNKPYNNTDLMVEVVNLVNSKVAQSKKTPTIHQVLASIEEIYLHSLQKNSGKADHDFANWFMGLIGK